MKVYTFVHSILGITAMWMIRQYRAGTCGVKPRGFDEVLERLYEKIIMSETFKKNQCAKGEDMFFLADEIHLRKFLTTQLLSIPEFLELNLRDVEWNIGLRAKDVDDDDKRYEKLKAARVPMGAFRYDKNDQLKPEYDFIDLDALIRNICNSIMSEQNNYQPKEDLSQSTN